MFFFSLAALARGVLHTRDYFYVGGQYVPSGAGGYLFENQMYVEHLTPAKVSQPHPIVFMHGGAQSGTNFLTKPDGGSGWADWFLDHGYEVYLVDEPTRARSPWNPAGGFPQSTWTDELISSRFTAVRDSTLWPQAKLHTQWPGTGKKGDPVFDAFYQSNMQFIVDGTEQERTVKEAGTALLDKLGRRIVLVTHSQGGLYGWGLADARPDQIAGLIQIEPKGPPFREVIFSTSFTRPWGLTSIPLTYSPAPTNLTSPLETQVVKTTSADLVDCIIQAEPAKKLVNIAKVPILVDTGEASYHAAYDHCTVMFLKQAGVENIEFLELGKAGIHGNSHMQFMEMNSDAIAEKLHDWILQTVEQKHE
ncbi:Alpha/Beta hydrolase protein [Microdochium trichocladiopsis]|uniref:Alpha/Beta hydrolase protein n=1 Tax=Microdochium trichocladiopsis TaxID=1682393 RepID=A0A9P9BQX2_9PEZI|nr:Alpha/Beta hydrolase protein [Microdochium trichocladiopsis]KAH7031368.1 Alpha/Beta hydrolase protein [Microdochium trichocladiopsis]